MLSKGESLCLLFVFKSKDLYKNFFVKTTLQRKFLKRILNRLVIYRSQIFKGFLTRSLSELAFYLERFLSDKKERALFVDENKIWLYIFQIESIRAAQLGKLAFTKDQSKFFTKEIFNTLKTNNSFYNSYNFLTLQKIKTYSIVLELLTEVPSNIINPVIPFDIALESILFEFKKRIFFFYNSFYFNLDDNRSDFNFSTCLPSLFEVEALNSLFSLRSSKLSVTVSSVFEIFLSIPFIFTRFRLLGFLHTSKNLPISNSRLLLLQDKDIIQYYGNFAFNTINWYRCVFNISKLKLVISILRQSCLLTLSRKHNKRKSWAYFIFTPDLLILRGLFMDTSFFPSRVMLSKLSRKFFLSEKAELLFEEVMFLR